MSRPILLGPGLPLDLERLLQTRLLVQANSGAGKSWALRRLLEQTHGKVQQIVIDPEGEFASLREKFDYVLAARQGGETLADPRVAKLLAERLLELGVSAIIDIYELKPHERVRFVRLFLDALVEAPKTLWHPVLVLLDEAHVYAPEQGNAESADAVKSLATRGRKRGFCLVAATQRLSKLHKDVAAECNNKLIGRSSLDVDMKRAADELGFTTKEQRAQLRDLDAGEFFAFGPALVRTVQRVTIGSVETTHPKAGSKLAAVVPPPTDKVRALLPKLSDLPAEAEAREKTVADFRKEIANLKRELTEAKKAQPKTEVERVEVPVLTNAEISRLEKLTDKVAHSFGEIMIVAQSIDEKLRVFRHPTPHAIERSPNPRTLVPNTNRPPVHKVEPREPSEGRRALPLAERKIVAALAQYDTRSKKQIALLTGYAINGGGFNNAIGSLRSSGLVAGGKMDLHLTPDGRAYADDVPPLPIGRELVNHWLQQLGKCERAVLEYLVSHYPETVTKENLATACGYFASGGGFNNAIGRLRTLELITGGRDALRASDELGEAWQEAA